VVKLGEVGDCYILYHDGMHFVAFKSAIEDTFSDCIGTYRSPAGALHRVKRESLYGDHILNAVA
jgi:hypothetical protein